MRNSRRYFVIGIFGVVLAGAFVDTPFAGTLILIGLGCLVMSVHYGLKGWISGK